MFNYFYSLSRFCSDLLCDLFICTFDAHFIKLFRISYICMFVSCSSVQLVKKQLFVAITACRGFCHQAIKFCRHQISIAVYVQHRLSLPIEYYTLQHTMISVCPQSHAMLWHVGTEDLPHPKILAWRPLCGRVTVTTESSENGVKISLYT